ncbi:MAG: hypothetical protein JW842_02495 [Prolixibacteraceae bacterium]|nr:hypothetical protein [Prolixibacteraceae bacterium]
MSTPHQPLIPGQYYHVFNKSVGGEFLFKNRENYRYFMEKYRKYISPFADTLAWCLMPTHFHFLVMPLSLEKTCDPDKTCEGFKTLAGLAGKPLVEPETEGFDLSRKFSHLFNCYAQAYNKQNNRSGSLFKNRFKRVLIANNEQFRRTVVYIHLNPVHHKIESDFRNWKFSSFHDFTNETNSFLNCKKVLETFDGFDNFLYCHDSKQDYLINFFEE